jgi:hypothetical protein
MAPMGPFCKPRVFTRGYDLQEAVRQETAFMLLFLKGSRRSRQDCLLHCKKILFTLKNRVFFIK